MADTVSKAVRSKIMSKVPQRNTTPEKLVCSYLHRQGFRFRLHRRDLPGSPDIALPKYRTAIFVHGCFWHQHRGCHKSRKPTSNTEYWDEKLSANVVRDRKKITALKKLGWRVIVIWECQTKKPEFLYRKFATLN